MILGLEICHHDILDKLESRELETLSIYFTLSSQIEVQYLSKCLLFNLVIYKESLSIFGLIIIIF